MPQNTFFLRLKSSTTLPKFRTTNATTKIHTNNLINHLAFAYAPKHLLPSPKIFYSTTQIPDYKCNNKDSHKQFDRSLSFCLCPKTLSSFALNPLQHHPNSGVSSMPFHSPAWKLYSDKLNFTHKQQNNSSATSHAFLKVLKWRWLN